MKQKYAVTTITDEVIQLEADHVLISANGDLVFSEIKFIAVGITSQNQVKKETYPILILAKGEWSNVGRSV